VLRVSTVLALLALALATAAPAQLDPDFARQRAEWNQPFEPFRIAGTVHYVGTRGLAAYLITDPAGHILIDGAMEESAAQIAANVRKLGFSMGDVKIMLINHAHWDHSGGLADLKRFSGARLLASAADKPDLESGRSSYRADIAPAAPVRVDRVIRDGETIRLGATRLLVHLTPGHTKGCTSWTMRTQEAGRPLDILFACSLTPAGQQLVNDPGYPNAVADFRATFAKLKALTADIYLNYHPSFFDMEAKLERQRAGDSLAFVDPAELSRRIATAEATFAQELARQKGAGGGTQP
jgi:metallo-beta-lactamase class B